MAVWDLRASPVAVMLWPREWSLVMVGEKSRFIELFFVEKLTNPFAEAILEDAGEKTKKAKTKSPSSLRTVSSFQKTILARNCFLKFFGIILYFRTLI